MFSKVDKEPKLQLMDKYEGKDRKQTKIVSWSPVFVFQFRYKRRVYTQTHLDEKQLSKLHTKVRAHTVHAAVEQHLQDLKVSISKLLKRVSGSFLHELSLVIPDYTNQICQFQITSQMPKQTAMHQNDDQKHTFLHGFTTEVFVIITRVLGLSFVFLARCQLCYWQQTGRLGLSGRLSVRLSARAHQLDWKSKIIINFPLFFLTWTESK